MAWPQAHLEKEVLILEARLECATHSCLYLPGRIQMELGSHMVTREGDVHRHVRGGLGLDSAAVCDVGSREGS